MLCQMLKVARQERDIIDQKLGIVYDDVKNEKPASKPNARIKVISSTPSDSSGISGNISDCEIDERDPRKVAFQTEYPISKENRIKHQKLSMPKNTEISP